MTTLTAAEITAWLADPSAIRGTLIEVNVRLYGAGSDTTRYLSTFSYTTSPSDSPANTCYEAIVAGGLKYTEKMGVGTTPSLSVGDIELRNSDGELDSWLEDSWVNRSVKAYIGDVRWSRDKFFLIFDGIVSDVDSRNRNSINLKIRDKLQRLNTPITELKYEDVYPYPLGTNVTPVHNPLDPTNSIPQVAIPMCFGEVHNLSPVQIDPGNLGYIVHYGRVNDIIEMRDNGIPLSAGGYTLSATTGTITMNYMPAGQLTATIQGDAPGGTFTSKIGPIIRNLVKNYGKVVPNPVAPFGPTTRDGSMISGSYPNAPLGHPVITPSTERFTDSDIDLTNFSAFESANTQDVGVYITGSDNLLSVCQQLANSVGAQLCMGRLGKLQLLKLKTPTVSTFEITEDDMVFNSLTVVSKVEIQGSIKLGYAKNWTVQQTILTNIPEDHRQLFAQQWLKVIATDAVTVNKYNLSTDPDQKDTLLLKQGDAQAEADRLLAIYKEPHKVFRLTGFSPLLDLKLGDEVTLTSTRFGLSAGKLGTVISLQPDWQTAKVVVEVFV